jgi:hypothetical protein
MGIERPKPNGFDEHMRWFAHETREGKMYVQGLAQRECGVWLSVDGVQTLIGYGEPDEALKEVEAWAETQLLKVREQIEELKRNA